MKFALFMLLAACLTAQAGIKNEEVSYTANGVTMKGYLAYDDAKTGKRPGVLVVHEWWGHNEYARQRARMLAELGYVALAVDMYGDGKQAAHPDDAGKFAGAVLQNAEGAKARFMAALDFSYPGAKHSFTNPDADMFAQKFGLPIAYNAEADKKSWEDMQAFFKRILGK